MIAGPKEWELIGRVAIAAACGAVIGIERELSEKPAGLRTHALVALGSAAFTASGYAALSNTGTGSVTDVSRIAAQVVNGIGFLGGGIVIFHGDRLRGLTTAAEVWSVAAIGVLAGLGMVDLAIVATLMILLIVVGGRPVERTLNRVRRRNLLRRRSERRAKGELADSTDVEAEEELDIEEDEDVDVVDSGRGGIFGGTAA